jgi:hypothetical protein
VVSSSNPELRYDLATNVNGGEPSPVAAGLASPPTPRPTAPPPPPATPSATVEGTNPTPTVLAAPAAERSRPVWTAGLAAAAVLGTLGAAFVVWRRRGTAR